MSWHFSQALVAEFLEDTCSDGAPFAQSSSTPTPPAYCSPDRMTAVSRLSRFGMTFAPLTETHIAALLTWYLAGFPVRTLAQPEKGLASQVNGQDSGQKWPGLLGKYDPAMSLWKTAQCSLFEDLEPSLEIWPRWGSMRSGAAYQRQKPAHLISGIGCGLWVTPCAQDSRPITGGNLYQTTSGSIRAMREDGRSSNRGLEAQVMWQTPVADDAVNRTNGKFNSWGELKLSAQVMEWQTPTVQDANGMDRHNQRDGTVRQSLLGQARVWPTATATAYKGWSPKHNRANTDDRLDYTVERESFQPGQKTPPMRLNPAWVEWLMGVPLGWSDLRPLAMPKFQEWQQQHLLSLSKDLSVDC